MSSNKFKITSSPKKFNPTDAGVKGYKRLLSYIGISNKYIIITYKLGGLARSVHILLIKYFKNHVESIYNLSVSDHNKIEILGKILRSPYLKLENSSIF